MQHRAPPNPFILRKSEGNGYKNNQHIDDIMSKTAIKGSLHVPNKKLGNPPVSLFTGKIVKSFA